MANPEHLEIRAKAVIIGIFAVGVILALFLGRHTYRWGSKIGAKWKRKRDEKRKP